MKMAFADLNIRDMELYYVDCVTRQAGTKIIESQLAVQCPHELMGRFVSLESCIIHPYEEALGERDDFILWRSFFK